MLKLLYPRGFSIHDPLNCEVSWNNHYTSLDRSTSGDQRVNAPFKGLGATVLGQQTLSRLCPDSVQTLDSLC